MNSKTFFLNRLVRHIAVVSVAALLTPAIVGCQTSVGGQTLPSPHYLDDDVQYFPSGPEFLLSNQVRAIEQYKAERGEMSE